MLGGRVVIIIADSDKPGRDHARQVASSLRGIARSVRTMTAEVAPNAELTKERKTELIEMGKRVAPGRRRLACSSRRGTTTLVT